MEAYARADVRKDQRKKSFGQQYQEMLLSNSNDYNDSIRKANKKMKKKKRRSDSLNFKNENQDI